VSDSDAELTRGAQSGDVVALGLLLSRHRPGMRAVALSLLGHGQDADDAVQDASLVALLRIGDVRDPAAVGPWLRMIVRNAYRTRPRTRCWRTTRCATGLAEALLATEELATLIRDAELVILEHSGHFAHLEEPDTFTRAVTDFAQDRYERTLPLKNREEGSVHSTGYANLSQPNTITSRLHTAKAHRALTAALPG
jgi:DNA-directed RNA polymerase specialized sigma24 family protein